MKPRNIVLIVIVLLAAALLFLEDPGNGDRVPKSRQPITDSLLTVTYPQLYEAVYRRDAGEIFAFLDHPHEEVRRQAWRALASTGTDTAFSFADRVMESDTDAAWLFLSRQDLADGELRQLESNWLEQPQYQPGLSLVLGQQGDEESLQFLTERLQDTTTTRMSDEYEYALAVGRLMRNHALDEASQLKFLRRAFNVSADRTTRAYLYGYYRGNSQELSSGAADSLYSFWKNGMGNSALVDQYIARILGAKVFYELTLYYNSEEILDNYVQLAVELAQTLGRLELTERNQLAARMLVLHPNPHVAEQALLSIEGKVDAKADSSMYSFIETELLDSRETEPLVWLQAMRTLSVSKRSLVEERSERLKQIEEEHPYLLPKILQVRRQTESPGTFVSRIDSLVTEGSTLAGSYALGSLNSFWANMDDADKSAELREQIREIAFTALGKGDRGLAFATQSLLRSEDLFWEDDFSRINGTLNAFRLPEDIEVYQSFGSLYRQRFRDQAAPVIDSLAALGNIPLNRSLAQSGWDIEVPEEGEGTKFRSPDWERLWQLGRKPVWVLSTEKGVIRLELDVLSAPATVSAIDSLTVANAYDGVPFHRVIPDFVIQGGDIERGDGLGGPDFIIPTEASEEEYIRGMAGIASAGTDTEGSQYFIMHQWKPHLNGGYTLFGRVVEGMDVVARIVVGDTVEYAYWE